jgi:hypothetical protein
MAHMTAGNLKSLLPAGTEISRVGPTLIPSEHDRTVARVGFSFEGEPLLVDVIQAVSD